MKFKDIVKAGCYNSSLGKSSGCNFYGFLDFDCDEFGLTKLSTK